MLFKSLIGAAVVASLGHAASVPDPPTRYVTGIEANIANKNQTYLVIEWYDGDLQKGRRSLHYGELIFTFIEDYSNDTDSLWMYLQYARDDDTDDVLYCAMEAYSNQTSRFLSASGFFGKWLQSDGEMDDATYIGVVGDTDDNGIEEGDYNMRGLLSQKWMKSSNFTGTVGNTFYDMTMNISYYWSVPSWQYSIYNASEQSPIPLRLEVLGHHYSENSTGGNIQDYDFYHSYEYVGFFAGDDAFDDDELDFYSEMPNWVDKCDTSHYCQHYPAAEVCSESQGPDLPELSDRWLMSIEVNDIQNNISYFMKEYFDAANDRVHAMFFYDNSYAADAFHQLELDEVKQRWYWIGDETDTSSDLSVCQMDLIPDNFTGYDLFVKEINGHVASTASAFHFNGSSNNADKTWMGYTTVRGIDAEKWKGVWNESYDWIDNMYYVEYTADSYYYFNRDTWSMSTSNYSDDIPLRFEINGQYTIWNYSDDGESKVLWVNDTFDVSYDMVGFSNGNLDDSLFTIPENWREDCTISDTYCDDDRFSDLNVCQDGPDSLPELPPQFETTVEAVFVSKNYTMTVDEFYDYTNNRERVIQYPFTYRRYNLETSIPYSQHFLEDGEIFWSWRQNNGLGVDQDFHSVSDCELTLIRNLESGFLGTYFDIDAQHVQTTKGLFDWVANNSVQTYVGTKNVGGILCDRWKHKVQNYVFTFNWTDGNTYTYETNMTVIYAFMSDEFKSSDIYGDYGIPVRADVTGTTRITSPYTEVPNEYEYTHYYKFVRFIPKQPDDFWFTPPSNVTCNVTEYCESTFNYQSGSSSDDGIDGESSEEYDELCDEASNNGGVYIEPNTYTECEESKMPSNAALWVVFILLWIVFSGGCFYFGQYRERQSGIAKVRLPDETNP